MLCAVTRTKDGLDAISQFSNGPMAIMAQESLGLQMEAMAASDGSEAGR